MTAAARDTAYGGSGGGSPPAIPPVMSGQDWEIPGDLLVRGGSPWFDVLAWGADPTGVADSTDAIQDALDAAIVDGGGVVFMPAGIYKTTASLTIPPRVYLKGAGAISVSFNADLTTGTTTIQSSFNGSVVKFPAGYGGGIEDLMILGDTTQGSQILLDLGDPASLVASTRFTARRVHLKGAGLDCLVLRALLLESHFDQVYAHGAERYCLHANGNLTNVHKFTNCIFREAKQYGIKLVSGSYHFDTCVVESNSRHPTISYGGMYLESSGGSPLEVITTGQWYENNKGVHGNGVPIRMLGGGGVLPRLVEINTFMTEDKTSVIGVDTQYTGIGGAYATVQPQFSVASSYPCLWINPTGVPQFSIINTSGKGRIIGGLKQTAVPSVASAGTITLPGDEFVLVTGTTTITSITAGACGDRVTLQFAGALTLTDGSNLALAGNFVTTSADTITLVSDGTNWIETSRSVN